MLFTIEIDDELIKRLGYTREQAMIEECRSMVLAYDMVQMVRETKEDIKALEMNLNQTIEKVFKDLHKMKNKKFKQAMKNITSDELFGILIYSGGKITPIKKKEDVYIKGE